MLFSANRVALACIVLDPVGVQDDLKPLTRLRRALQRFEELSTKMGETTYALTPIDIDDGVVPGVRIDMKTISGIEPDPVTRTVLVSAPGCNDTDGLTPCRISQMSLDSYGRIVEMDPDGSAASLSQPSEWARWVQRPEQCDGPWENGSRMADATKVAANPTKSTARARARA